VGWGVGAVGGFAGEEGRRARSWDAISSSCSGACFEDSGRGCPSGKSTGICATAIRSICITGSADVPVATGYACTRGIAAVSPSVSTAAAISTSSQHGKHSKLASSSCASPTISSAAYLPQLANTISHSLGHINKPRSSSKASSRRTCIWLQWIASKWITSTAGTCQLLSSTQVAGAYCDRICNSPLIRSPFGAICNTATSDAAASRLCAIGPS